MNAAAHLQAFASAGEILVSAQALARGGAMRVDAARSIDLKGRAGTITVYPLADLTHEASEELG